MTDPLYHSLTPILNIPFSEDGTSQPQATAARASQHPHNQTQPSQSKPKQATPGQTKAWPCMACGIPRLPATDHKSRLPSESVEGEGSERARAGDAWQHGSSMAHGSNGIISNPPLPISPQCCSPSLHPCICTKEPGSPAFTFFHPAGHKVPERPPPDRGLCLHCGVSTSLPFNILCFLHYRSRAPLKPPAGSLG